MYMYLICVSEEIKRQQEFYKKQGHPEHKIGKFLYKPHTLYTAACFSTRGQQQL